MVHCTPCYPKARKELHPVRVICTVSMPLRSYIRYIRGINSSLCSMCYHFATILLFGPFVRLRFVTSALLPLEICAEAADAISSLLGTYTELYTLRRTPCFVPIINLASNTMHMVQTSLLSARIPLAVTHITHLQEMTFSHALASRGLRILITVRRICEHGALVGTKAMSIEAHSTSLADFTAPVIFFSSAMEIAPRTFDILSSNSIFSPFPTQSTPSQSQMALRERGFKLVDALS